MLGVSERGDDLPKTVGIIFPWGININLGVGWGGAVNNLNWKLKLGMEFNRSEIVSIYVPKNKVFNNI